MWKFFIFWIVLYVIYVFYLTIRALIDPKFAEKLSEMNRREKGKRGKELGNLVSMQQMAVGHHGVIAMEAQKVDIYYVLDHSFVF